MIEILQHWDEQVFILVNQTWSASWLDKTMILLSEKWPFIPAYLLLIYGFYKRFGKRAWLPVLMTLLAFAAADLVSARVLKNGVKRERPFLNETLHARLPDGRTGGNYGFVSSHASNMFALAMMVTLILRLRRRLIWIPFLLASLISYSRVYLGVHYPFDVICGAILGILLSLLIYLIFKKNLQKSYKSNPA